MRSIDRSRSVDAICAAQSCKRISIRDSVNCQSREQNQKDQRSNWFSVQYPKLFNQKMSPDTKIHAFGSESEKLCITYVSEISQGVSSPNSFLYVNPSYYDSL